MINKEIEFKHRLKNRAKHVQENTQRYLKQNPKLRLVYDMLYNHINTNVIPLVNKFSIDLQKFFNTNIPDIVKEYFPLDNSTAITFDSLTDVRDQINYIINQQNIGKGLWKVAECCIEAFLSHFKDVKLLEIKGQPMGPTSPPDFLLRVKIDGVEYKILVEAKSVLCTQPWEDRVLKEFQQYLADPESISIERIKAGIQKYRDYDENAEYIANYNNAIKPEQTVLEELKNIDSDLNNTIVLFAYYYINPVKGKWQMSHMDMTILSLAVQSRLDRDSYPWKFAGLTVKNANSNLNVCIGLAYQDGWKNDPYFLYNRWLLNSSRCQMEDIQWDYKVCQNEINEMMQNFDNLMISYSDHYKVVKSYKNKLKDSELEIALQKHIDNVRCILRIEKYQNLIDKIHDDANNRISESILKNIKGKYDEFVNYIQNVDIQEDTLTDNKSKQILKVLSGEVGQTYSYYMHEVYQHYEFQKIMTSSYYMNVQNDGYITTDIIKQIKKYKKDFDNLQRLAEKYYPSYTLYNYEKEIINSMFEKVLTLPKEKRIRMQA